MSELLTVRKIAIGAAPAAADTWPDAAWRHDFDDTVAQALGIDIQHAPTAERIRTLLLACRPSDGAPWDGPSRRVASYQLVFSAPDGASSGCQSPDLLAAQAHAVEQTMRFMEQSAGHNQRGEPGRLGWLTFAMPPEPAGAGPAGPAGATQDTMAPLRRGALLFNLVVNAQGRGGALDPRAMSSRLPAFAAHYTSCVEAARAAAGNTAAEFELPDDPDAAPEPPTTEPSGLLPPIENQTDMPPLAVATPQAIRRRHGGRAIAAPALAAGVLLAAVAGATLSLHSTSRRRAPSPEATLQTTAFARLAPVRIAARPVPVRSLIPLVPPARLLAPPPSQAPGIVLIASRGDTLAALYRKIYQGLTPPSYEAVVAANRRKMAPGETIVFPAPPAGWAP